MTDVTERIMKLLEKIAVKKSTETAAKAEYVEKAKLKALTQGERIDRTEKILGII